MIGSTGTAVLARHHWSELAQFWSPPAQSDCSVVAGRASTGDRMPVDPLPSIAGSGPAGVPARTAAGAKAMRRRRARQAADRRPPSGVLPSGTRRSAVVAADRGDEVDDRIQPIGRWARLACTLCFTATAVLVAVVVLSSGGAQAIGPVVVQPGDTLWSVAERSDPGADPRAVVQRIKELNELPSDAVVAGAVLQVPVSTP